MMQVLRWVLAMTSVQGVALYCGLHAVLNVTPSLPVGLYWRLAPEKALRHGQMVELTPPDAVLPYLASTPAGANLMKQVAGIAGDTACWDMTAMVVNGTVIPRVSSRALPQALRGCRTLMTTEFLVVGTHPRSLDSRDIGPVDGRRVLYQLVPLWTWSAL